TEFKTVYDVGDELVVVNEEIREPMRSDLLFVLRWHRIPFRQTADGRILVPCRIMRDTELVWNLTGHAQDKNLLKRAREEERKMQEWKNSHGSSAIPKDGSQRDGERSREE
ncbi:MAG: hypothetical protein V2A73_04995, partial [Pseudomonadota bacterium]